MGYPTIRADHVVTATYDTALSTTPVRVSGGSASLVALGNVPPCQVRQGITIANQFNSTQNFFIGTTNAVTSAGVASFAALAPGQEKTFAFNGTVDLWVVAAAAGGKLGIVEWQ